MRTVGDYRKAVKKARAVYCTPRFGVIDTPIRISKADALYLVQGYRADETADNLEMPSNEFGYFDGNILFIG